MAGRTAPLLRRGSNTSIAATAKTRRIVVILGLVRDGDESAAAAVLAGRAVEAAHEDPVTRVDPELGADVVAQRKLERQPAVHGVADPLVELPTMCVGAESWRFPVLADFAKKPGSAVQSGLLNS